MHFRLFLSPLSHESYSWGLDNVTSHILFTVVAKHCQSKPQKSHWRTDCGSSSCWTLRWSNKLPIFLNTVLKICYLCVCVCTRTCTYVWTHGHMCDNASRDQQRVPNPRSWPYKWLHVGAGNQIPILCKNNKHWLLSHLSSLELSIWITMTVLSPLFIQTH